MKQAIFDVHQGIRFEVEAIPRGDEFVGRFKLLDEASPESGLIDSYRPTIDNAWATELEALNYATEAAHHAIERVLPFVSRARGE